MFASPNTRFFTAYGEGDALGVFRKFGVLELWDFVYVMIRIFWDIDNGSFSMARHAQSTH